MHYWLSLVYIFPGQSSPILDPNQHPPASPVPACVLEKTDGYDVGYVWTERRSAALGIKKGVAGKKGAG